ncbi:hypothetical protein T190607A02C_20271 [Tenacibaculum sp. 190524A02b]
MLTETQKSTINNIIMKYNLSNWMEVCEIGVKMNRLTSDVNTKNRNKITLIVVVLIVLKMLASNKIPEFVFWMFGGIGVLFVTVKFYMLKRELVFDLINGVVELSVMGITLKKQKLKRFKDFTSEGGFIINGFDLGGNLYMKFTDGEKIQIAQLRDFNVFKSIQYAIIEFKELSFKIT